MEIIIPRKTVLKLRQGPGTLFLKHDLENSRKWDGMIKLMSAKIHVDVGHVCNIWSTIPISKMELIQS